MDYLVHFPHLSLQYLDDKARVKDAVKLGKVWSSHYDLIRITRSFSYVVQLYMFF